MEKTRAASVHTYNDKTPFFLEQENITGRSHDDQMNGVEDSILSVDNPNKHDNKVRQRTLSSKAGARTKAGKSATAEKVKSTKTTKDGKAITPKASKAAKIAKSMTAGKSSKAAKSSKCNPETDVVLSDYQQWEDETGYWIGEYSFFQGDGTPYVSTSWPYPYDSYMGFITGNVSGNKYRQRNVFLYPPEPAAECSSLSPPDNVVGNGTCGVNGNTKIFEADQAANECDDGNISGPYGSGMFMTDTYTTLVGQDNAVLYQVYVPASTTSVLFGESEPRLLQSQLTTITKSPSGEIRRTRSAQGFNAFSFDGTQHITNSMSYYRERKVTKEEFYAAFIDAQSRYNILDADLCKWDNNGADVMGGGDGSMDACIAHLEESFSF